MVHDLVLFSQWENWHFTLTVPLFMAINEYRWGRSDINTAVNYGRLPSILTWGAAILLVASCYSMQKPELSRGTDG